MLQVRVGNSTESLALLPASSEAPSLGSESLVAWPGPDGAVPGSEIMRRFLEHQR
jgi:hypothetical protein